ncbi:MAG: prepilin-type N-terminal cleavage/methylation domain-containing protein [Clostridium sp.]|nr:prepilin-type N-terminal cleavage/methylation domain-containing protein [Clostridium sp.]
MRRKIQKYLSGEREGFSLIELIIVIAIMAILIGIVALAVIPYLEKSRVGKDQQTVDTVYSAFQATLADQKITKDATVTIPSSGAATGEGAADNAFLNAMAQALNAKDASEISSGTAGKLESADAKDGKIICSYKKDSGTIEVYATQKDGTTKTSIVSSNKNNKK